jgi:predicted hotdog family 3-hydroxylacyl-ACP dehydratase
MNFEEIDIKTLLPQQPPFVMVDALVNVDKRITCTRLKVRENNIFVEDGVLTESGVIENIAQSCAARMGYISKFGVVGEESEVKIGFVGSIKDLVFENLPKVGEELHTTVEMINEVFNITLVTAKVEVGSKLIASCEMKISLTDKEV